MLARNRRYRSLNVSNSRWTAYAVASLAAASGAAAEGAIHYTDPTNVVLRDNDLATFPLDDLGDKLLFIHRNHSPYTWWAAFGLVGPLSGSLCFQPGIGTFAWITNLDRSSPISQQYFRAGYFGTMAIIGFGPFVRPGIGFIGFAFNNGSGKQYGWVRVQMGGGAPGERENAFKVLDYAYADPGEPIKAGQRSDEPVTDMGSLGLLAAGAAGLLTWRKSRRGRGSSAAA